MLRGELVTSSGRKYTYATVLVCQECAARLDDEDAVAIHESWHASMKRHWPIDPRISWEQRMALRNAERERERVVGPKDAEFTGEITFDAGVFDVWPDLVDPECGAG